MSDLEVATVIAVALRCVTLNGDLRLGVAEHASRRDSNPRRDQFQLKEDTGEHQY